VCSGKESRVNHRQLSVWFNRFNSVNDVSVLLMYHSGRGTRPRSGGTRKVD